MTSERVVYAPPTPLPPPQHYKYPVAPKEFFLTASWFVDSFTKYPLAVAGGVINYAESWIRKPPSAPDRLSQQFVQAPSDPQPEMDLFKTVMTQMTQGTLVQDALTLISGALQGLEASRVGGLDDRKMLLEQVVIMLSTLPPNSVIGTSLTNTLIRFLWADLDHPPVAYVGANRYRQADGSGNSPWDVQLGASHTAYARSVPPMHPLPPNLPDPGTLFDALLKRDEFVPHPSGISSLLFNFATTIIHSCFQTSLADPNINEASSYLDLSIIYGNNQDEQNKVRTGKLGLMHPDVVSSSRLFLMPAAVTTLAVVFTRNHNLIAEKLLGINEGGRFTPKPPRKPQAMYTPGYAQDHPDVVKYKEDTEKDPKGLVQQDEDLFQTARLVNCGWFLNVIFQDYIRAILNINRSNSLWSLVPTGVIRPPLQGPFPRGVGNAVAVEFNILYRWHAAISAQDEEWIEMEMKKWGPRGKQPVDYTEEDFFTVYFNMTKALGPDSTKWNIPGIKRKSDGYFEDRDLVNILSAATKNVAGAFKARGSPAAMRIIDMMGISAARSTWGTCSLNEFRKFLGLEQFTQFKQWNSDPKIIDIASQLYTHVDNIELFPGLLAEEAKPSMPGSGLGPGYTVSRAILSDAAALVRGDRYFCQDMNANNFTVYQFEELTPDLEGGSFGGVLGKLFMRVFPEQYSFNSAYALFAFSTPATTEDILRKLGIKQQYNLAQPLSPAAPAKTVRRVHTFEGCKNMLSDRGSYVGVYGSQEDVTNAPSIEVALFDKWHVKAEASAEVHRVGVEALNAGLFHANWKARVAELITADARKRIVANSWTYVKGSQHLNILRDVYIPSSMTLIAEQFGIPLKTKEKKGFFTAQDLYRMLCDCYTYVYLNFEPKDGFALRKRVAEYSHILGHIISVRLTRVGNVADVLAHITERAKEFVKGAGVMHSAISGPARAFYTAINVNAHKGQLSHEDISNLLISALITSVNIAHVAANATDFYLDKRDIVTDINRLANANNEAADQRIAAYIMESLRLSPVVPGVMRRAKQATRFRDGQQTAQIDKDELLFADYGSAMLDATAFPNPDQVQTGRNINNYKMLLGGYFKSSDVPCDSYIVFAAVELVKEAFKLRDLHRDAGAPGQLGRITNHNPPYGSQYMLAQGTLSYFPQGLTVVYSG